MTQILNKRVHMFSRKRNSKELLNPISDVAQVWEAYSQRIKWSSIQAHVAATYIALLEQVPRKDITAEFLAEHADSEDHILIARSAVLELSERVIRIMDKNKNLPSR